MQLPVRLVTWVHVGEGDGFIATGQGKFEGKVALLRPHGPVVNPARN